METTGEVIKFIGDIHDCFKCYPATTLSISGETITASAMWVGRECVDFEFDGYIETLYLHKKPKEIEKLKELCDAAKVCIEIAYEDDED